MSCDWNPHTILNYITPSTDRVCFIPRVAMIVTPYRFVTITSPKFRNFPEISGILWFWSGLFFSTFHIFHHFFPVFTTFSNFFQLFPTVSHFSQLLATFHYFSPLFATLPHFSPLSTTFHHFSPLLATFHQF